MLATAETLPAALDHLVGAFGTQQALADEIGVGYRTVGKWRKGRERPKRPENIARLHALGVPMRLLNPGASVADLRRALQLVHASIATIERRLNELESEPG